MSYVLALALGPVQEFIAAARKARDLWAGSQMLSDCSGAAAWALLAGGGTELVFPHPDDLARGASVVNKIVAIVKDGGDPRTLAEAARAAARGVLTSRQADAWTMVGAKGATGVVVKSLLTEQVGGFLEFYAAWYPFEGDGEYERARAEADRLLAGRKALRDFAPPPATASASGRQKSALDPSRESVLEVPARYHPEYEARVGRLARLQIRPTEFLDGVSLVKRTARLQQFVSVSRVAVDPFVRRLARDRPEDLQALRDLAEQLAKARDEETPVQRLHGNQTQLSHFEAFPYDTQLFYDAEPPEEFEPGDEATKAQEFQRLVRDLRGPKGIAIGEISPYFALLVADGDRMGAAISALKRPEEHAALSQALSGFAAAVEAVTAEHSGALIYSGGDDVLAFLPLDTALNCADDLRREFAQALGDLKLENPPRDVKLENPPTLSVGVSIGHFGTALDRLLEWGRGAEKLAKTQRNALAVTLHTRSSGEAGVGTVASWSELPVEARWEHWVTAYREDAVPVGFAYKLRVLAREVAGDKGQHVTAGLITAEVWRLLRKSRRRRGTEKIESKFIEALLGFVNDDSEKLDQVVTELLIARHLARAKEIAEGPLKGGGGQP